MSKLIPKSAQKSNNDPKQPKMAEFLPPTKQQVEHFQLRYLQVRLWLQELTKIEPRFWKAFTNLTWKSRGLKEEELSPLMLIRKQELNRQTFTRQLNSSWNDSAKILTVQCLMGKSCRRQWNVLKNENCRSSWRKSTPDAKISTWSSRVWSLASRKSNDKTS